MHLWCLLPTPNLLQKFDAKEKRHELQQWIILKNDVNDTKKTMVFFMHFWRWELIPINIGVFSIDWVAML